MKNLFNNAKNANTTSSTMQQPAMLELSEQELEQASGGDGHGHHHRHWYKEYRRDHYGREIVVIIVDQY